MSQPAGCGRPAHRRVRRGSLGAAEDARPGAFSGSTLGAEFSGGGHRA